MARSVEELEEILRQTVEEARRRLPLAAAYLFGSHAEGNARDDSDIDIALFSAAADEMTLPERIDTLVDIDKAIDAEVEPHLYSDKCLQKARPSNIYGHILATGRKIA